MCAQSAFAGGILYNAIGQRVLTVNGVPCNSPAEFVTLVKAAPAPGQVTLQVAPTSVVAASITKSHEEQKVGFSMVSAGAAGSRIIQISRIDPMGLFANSALRVGMNLMQINEHDVTYLEGGVKEAVAILKSIPAGTTINVIAVDNMADTRIPKQQKRWSYSRHTESEVSGRIVTNPNPPTPEHVQKKKFSFDSLAMNNKRNSLV